MLIGVSIMLIHLLAKLRFKLSDKNYILINNLISPNIVNDNSEIGWEDITNANINYILKILLKKDIKD